MNKNDERNNRRCNGDTFKKIKTLNNSDSFDIIVNKLKIGKPFSFVRFGDADYLMMFKENINNIIGYNNKFLVTRELHDEIIETHNIIDENFLIGSVIDTSIDNKLYSYKHFFREYNITNLDINYNNLLSAVTLTETFSFNFNKFSEFVDEIKKYKIMFVGNYFHTNLKYLYGNQIIEFVETPIQNSFSKVDQIYNEILSKINNIDLIIFSTGQTSRIIIKRLWKNNINKIMLDVGSLSDFAVLDTFIEKYIPVRNNIKKNKNTIIQNFNKIKANEG